MTKHKFTPPTQFPAEYVTEGGQKAVILGRAPVGDYPLIGYVLHTEGGSAWPDCSSSGGFTEDGQYHTDWPSPDDLHDTLEVTAYVSQLEQAEARIEELEANQVRPSRMLDAGKLESTVGHMQVTGITEHEDGGATIEFDMDDTTAALAQELGLKLLIYCGATGTNVDYVFDSILGKELDNE